MLPTFKKMYKNWNNIKILIKTEKQYFSYIKITLLRGVAMRLLGYIKSVSPVLCSGENGASDNSAN